MKGYLVELLQGARNPLHGRHLVREYLQARILAGLQRAGAMIPLAFHGGTALRFLYRIPRYSEDLDFALEGAPEHYDLQAYVRTIRSDLTVEGYSVELRVSEQRVVQSAFVRFPGLLHDLGLSPHAGEVLSIKLEVDTRPPDGACLATTFCCICTITIALRCWRASSTPSCNGRMPKDATCTISSGTCRIQNGQLRT
jgi:hypothetical protein